MAKKRKRIRRSTPEEVQEAILEEEDELEDEDEVEEEVPPVRKARKVQDVEEDEFEDDDEDLEDDDDDYDEDDDDDEDDDEPEPTPARRVTRKVAPPVAKTKVKVPPKPGAKKAAKPASAPAVEDETPQAVAVKRVDTIVAENVMTGLLDALDEGQSVVITRTGANTWQISSSNAVAAVAGKKLRGAEYWAEVLTKEYTDYQEMWSELSTPEKKKKAKAAGAKWDTHKDERVELIRISTAYMAKMGIQKYKPEYQKLAAREAIKG